MEILLTYRVVDIAHIYNTHDIGGYAHALYSNTTANTHHIHCLCTYSRFGLLCMRSIYTYIPHIYIYDISELIIMAMLLLYTYGTSSSRLHWKQSAHIIHTVYTHDTCAQSRSCVVCCFYFGIDTCRKKHKICCFQCKVKPREIQTSWYRCMFRGTARARRRCLGGR